MNSVLRDTLLRLHADRIRVVVIYQSRYGGVHTRTGYIRMGEDQCHFKIRSRSNAHSSWYMNPEYDVVIKEIRAAKGRRRKSGMYYDVYYQELPYVPTGDGTLDITATLRGLLAVA
jgi:hypothetical protein